MQAHAIADRRHPKLSNAKPDIVSGRIVARDWNRTVVLGQIGAGQVGGMLAAMLDLPYASVVNLIEPLDDKKMKVGREIEGGNIEMNTISLPCVLSIQTGINEPRYVGIRGIRKVASVEIPIQSADDLGLAGSAVSSDVKRLDYFVPEMGEGAEMLEGDNDEIIEKLIEMLKAKGGLK